MALGAVLATAAAVVWATTPAASADTIPNFGIPTAWYNDQPVIDSSLPDWMGTIPDGDNLNLAELSIPGTHDTMALYDPFLGFAQSQTQSLSLIAQLNAGIRYIDIRAQCNENHTTHAYYFKAYHGITNQYADVQRDVLDVLQTFLTAHPTETVLMRFSHSGVPDTPSSTACDNYTDGVRYLLRQYPSLFWGNPYGPHPIQFTETTPAPKLSAARGKIVMLQGFGYQDSPNQFGVYVDYDNPISQPQINSVDLYDALPDRIWNVDRPHLEAASAAIYNAQPNNHNSTLYETGFNASVAVVNKPWVNALVTNQDLLHWLLSNQAYQTGVVAMDYPGPGVIAAVVAHNLVYRPYGVPGVLGGVAPTVSEVLRNTLRSVSPYSSSGDDGGAHTYSDNAYNFLAHVMPGQNWNVTAFNHSGGVLIHSLDGFAPAPPEFVHYQYPIGSGGDYIFAWSDPRPSAPDGWQDYFKSIVVPLTTAGDIATMLTKMSDRYPQYNFAIFDHKNPGGGYNWWMTAPHVSQLLWDYNGYGYQLLAYATGGSLSAGRGAVVGLGSVQGSSARVTLSPASARPGQAVTAHGSKFSPGEKVTAALHSATVDLGSHTADANGALTFRFIVPKSVSAGHHTVTLEGRSSTDSASAALTVEKLPGPSPRRSAPGQAANPPGAAPAQPGVLANTGAAVRPMVGASVLLLAVGLFLLWLGLPQIAARSTRRRKLAWVLPRRRAPMPSTGCLRHAGCIHPQPHR